MSNGLDSPLCKGALGAGELSLAARRNCVTSGFVAAAAPTGDYGLDVHIDTGVLGLSSNGLLSTVQTLLVAPLWMAIVWVVHAMIVMLEWCFTIDLLDSSAAAGVGGGLRQMQASLSEPWLAIVLAGAAIMAAYNGLIRRRVAETIGEALLMGSMIVAGLWVIADPSGTVGALGSWANRASLGTLAVAARGVPSTPGKALGESMDTVFAAVVEAPWCYLEFGDVGWCRDPARLDARVRAAGLQIARAESAALTCKSTSITALACVAPGSSAARALEQSAQLLREAQSNGAVFLSLPANGPARNSINERGSLLSALCASSDATSCRGPTAAEAEFRTSSGTWSRVGGLLLIGVGALGMILLLGFLAMRLLGAAIFSLLYLLLAPALVLAPALGEGGRAVFRGWLSRLLGAVLSKLLFSFLLGVTLAVVAILADLKALGWWTQWLLMSAFWWGAFLRRHQALGVAMSAVGREHGYRPQSIARRVSSAVEEPRRALAAAHAIRTRFASPAHDGARADQGWAGRGPARERTGEDRDVHAEQTGAPRREPIASGGEARRESDERLAAKALQLQRVRGEHARALAAADSRRAIELAHRARRIEDEIAGERRARGEGHLSRRGDRRAEPPRSAREPAGAHEPADAHERSGATRGQPSSTGPQGHPPEPSGRPAQERRDARPEIDRELAVRRELNESARAPSPDAAGASRRSSKDGRAENPRSRMPPDRRPARPSESGVMRDAREVAARRKRQLGKDKL